MFTVEQIEELHGRLGKAETLAEDVRSLAGLGVARYDSFVSDGHSECWDSTVSQLSRGRCTTCCLSP